MNIIFEQQGQATPPASLHNCRYWYINRRLRTWKAFQATVVYDQDRLFLVSENHGDLILTEKFRFYSWAAGFALHLCRKRDPESKGKIENAVKYVKQNFLYNRPFDDIETPNQQALAWLSRTANCLAHAVTRKSPQAEWDIEKHYLRPVIAVLAAPADRSFIELYFLAWSQSALA